MNTLRDVAYALEGDGDFSALYSKYAKVKDKVNAIRDYSNKVRREHPFMILYSEIDENYTILIWKK